MLEINSISVIIYLYSGNDKIMEVVSTSNLVSSENVKKKKKTAMNSFVIPHDWPNGNLCIYANIKLFVVSLWQNCEIVP